MSRKLLRAALRATPKKKHKFNAVKTVVDGIRFDSKRESQRYLELKLLEKAGEIIDLRLQPKYELAVYGHAHWPDLVVGKYCADFSYFDVRARVGVVEDVKGVRTALYKWKKKHCELQYGLTIMEV